MRIDDVLQRIQGEFVEMPGLRLTPAQAQRLWGLERDVCDALLGALVDAKFLAQTRDGAFIRLEGARPTSVFDGSSPRPNGRGLEVLPAGAGMLTTCLVSNIAGSHPRSRAKAPAARFVGG